MQQYSTNYRFKTTAELDVTKGPILKSVIFFCLFAIFGCAPISERRDWGFVEQVGGLKVGEQISTQSKNATWLYLYGDLSGSKEFSTKPTQKNSTVALNQVKVDVVENKIQIYLETTKFKYKYATSKVKGVRLSGIKPGKYIVQYINRDGSTIDLKEVEIF